MSAEWQAGRPAAGGPIDTPYAGRMSEPASDASSVPPASLRERKRDATRQAIEDAAWDLFMERGFDATTVPEIAERANVAPRTFFRYFPTKEAVLYPEIDELIADLAAAFEARPLDEPALVSLVHAMDAISNEMLEQRERSFQRFEMLKRTSRSTTSVFVTGRVADAVADMVRRRAAGDPDVEVQARLAAGVLSLVLSLSLEQWVERGGVSSIEEEATGCFDTLRRLVGAPVEPA